MDTRLYASQTHSDGANFLISLARCNWVDAVASAVSIVPYIGDLAKTAKLPRYIRSVRKAIDIARFDFKWARALRELFAKLKQVLDECSKLADDLLPDAAIKQLKALKDEIDNFLSMKGGTTGKPSGSGKKTGGQSSDTTKPRSKRNRPKPAEKLDKKPEKEYGPGKDDGPKTKPKSGIDRINDIRSKINISKRKNIAYADYSLDGKKGELISVSGKKAPDGTVGNPSNRIFETIKTGNNPRAYDSEVKILEDIASKITSETKGTINLFTERPACISCQGVIRQFRQKFPNIKLTVGEGPG